MSLLCFIFLSSFTSILCMLELALWYVFILFPFSYRSHSSPYFCFLLSRQQLQFQRTCYDYTSSGDGSTCYGSTCSGFGSTATAAATAASPAPRLLRQLLSRLLLLRVLYLLLSRLLLQRINLLRLHLLRLRLPLPQLRLHLLRRSLIERRLLLPRAAPTVVVLSEVYTAAICQYFQCFLQCMFQLTGKPTFGMGSYVLVWVVMVI